MSPEQILATPASILADQPSDALFEIKLHADTVLIDAMVVARHIERALQLKYAARARELRLAAGKDTGIVHFDDGAVRISADLTKDVEWNQKLLAQMAQRIAAAGDDPAKFIEMSYRVSEAKYLAWEESLRSQFTPARTVKTGKASFRLALVNTTSRSL